MDLSSSEKHIIDLLRAAEPYTVVTITKNPPMSRTEYVIEVMRREFIVREDE